MNEMLYGNNGQNDECLNVGMDQALFTRVKGTAFVHALRRVINVHRAVPDSNFVYIASVDGKESSYTLYGYQARLIHDSRGGDWGNYIATACDKKKPAMNFPGIKFATEDGFRQYFNESKIGEENRFSVPVAPAKLSKNALMLLVNNVMEMFTGNKINTCTFCLSTESDEAFSSKSIYVLALLLKYLPYGIRKNIAFISRVDADMKTPNMINLAAYASDNSRKPRECINLEGDAALTNGMFKNYVEKVFAMDDGQREAYFEQLYTEIEKPLADKNLSVKGRHYLLDTETKALWATGSDEAVKNVIDTAGEIIMFPEYTLLAKKLILENGHKVLSYIAQCVAKAAKIEDMKKLYSNVSNLFTSCGFGEGDMNKVNLIFANKADEFFNLTTNRDEFVACADSAKSVSVNIIGAGAKQKMGDAMYTGSLEEFFSVYSLFKEKKYVSDEELNKIALAAGENVVEYMVSSTPDSKDKLDILTMRYDAFAMNTAGDYSVVTELYNIFRDKYSGNANSEARRYGAQVLEEIKESIRYSTDFSRFADYFEKLASIDTTASTDLKAQTGRIYCQVVEYFKDNAITYDISGNQFMDILKRVAVCVEKLERDGIYDGPVVIMGNSQDVPDGIGRLMYTFKGFMSSFKDKSTLVDAIKYYDRALSNIMPNETKNGIIFKKYAPKMFKLWTRGTKFNKCTSKDLVVGLKKLEKSGRVFNMDGVNKLIEYFDLIPEEKVAKKRGGVNVMVIIIAAAVAVIIASVIGILFGTGVINLSTDPTEETMDVTESEPIVVSPQTVANVTNYINSFNSEGSVTAVVLGNVDINSADNSVQMDVVKAFGGETTGRITVKFEPNELSKNFLTVSAVSTNPESKFAFIIQSVGDGEKVHYVRDIVMLPDWETYNPGTFNPGNLEGETASFYNEVVQYIGVQDGALNLEHTVSEPVSEEGQGEAGAQTLAPTPEQNM